MQIVKFEKILLKGESDEAHALRFFKCLAAGPPVNLLTRCLECAVKAKTLLTAPVVLSYDAEDDTLISTAIDETEPDQRYFLTLCLLGDFEPGVDDPQDYNVLIPQDYHPVFVVFFPEGIAKTDLLSSLVQFFIYFCKGLYNLLFIDINRLNAEAEADAEEAEEHLTSIRFGSFCKKDLANLEKLYNKKKESKK